MNQYVQPTACNDCPFNESGPGRVLRDSLGHGRWTGIQQDIAMEKVFHCHKTVTHDEDGDGEQIITGNERVCAGALAFQRQHNCVPSGIQVIERLTAMREKRKARW